MIDILETNFRLFPDRKFFWFVDARAHEVSYTYQETRIISAALALRLQEEGVCAGNIVVADLPSCPELVFLILACAYGGFSPLLLNESASEGEKLARVLELKNKGKNAAFQFNLSQIRRMIPNIYNLPSEASEIIAGIVSARRARAIFGEQEDIVQDTVHFAERAAHIFNRSASRVYFLSGGKNSKKVVSLTWEQLIEASLDTLILLESENRGYQSRIALENRDSFQCVLPLYMVDGFQTVVRATLSQRPFRLYAAFDAELVLRDAERFHAVHISLREKMLQDMLTIEEWRQEISRSSSDDSSSSSSSGGNSSSNSSSARASRLTEYDSILICNRSINARTLERAVEAKANIFVAFGMTETAGTIAAALVTSDFGGGLKVGKHTDIHILDADEEGFGRLAVKGEGIFDGYCNANTPKTADDYFLTGEKAVFFDGCLYIKNRGADMFVSNGENIYPAEIADALRHVPGVSCACVLGVTTQAGYKVPVAVVEPVLGSGVKPEDVYMAAKQWLAPASVPTEIAFIRQLPRTESGRIDRKATEWIFLNRPQLQV